MTGRGKRIQVTTVAIALLAAAFFLVSFAPFANAGNMSSQMMAVKGEITAVDSYGQTITVKSVKSLEMAPAMYTFKVNRDTGITACAQNRTFHALTAGEKVDVSYHSQSGRLFADAINIRGTDLARCYLY